MRKGLFWCLGVFVSLLIPQNPCLGSFVASPMEHHLTIEAGSQGIATVTVQNTGNHPLTLKLYLSDSHVFPDGQEEDRYPGFVERSCAPWSSLRDQLLELAPGELRRTEVRINVPGNARGSYWTKLYIEEISTPKPSTREIEGRSYHVFMRQRVGIRIFENVRGTEAQDAKITLVDVIPVETGRKVLTYIDNAGNSILRCVGRVEVRDVHGNIIETLQFNSGGKFWVFPGNHRELVVTTKTRLVQGTYTALSIVDFGGEHLIAGEEMFQVEEDEGDFLVGKGENAN